MPEYLVLIYEDEQSYATADQATFDEVMKAHNEFGAKHSEALRGGHALQPTSTATSLRRAGSGELVTTDAAFAEAKEALGGYYLIEAADLDEALRIAADVPARFGGVEVRPIMTFD